ncbi:MAG TPA: hypothetical protein VMI56_17780 [Reyranella sp.]|nr:hypothetical protein [Reyranella sp.]
MNPTKLFVVAAFGLSAGACTAYESQAVVAPGPMTASEQACVDYGFTPGTGSYDRCVSREHAARVAGRVSRGYAVSQLNADARAACYSYGLEPGTVSYDRCVGREIDARRWRETAYVEPGYGTYTTVTTTYNTAPPYTASAPATTPPAGVQAFRDEYGFRYDGQGNRIDASGNIISPHSTQP